MGPPPDTCIIGTGPGSSNGKTRAFGAFRWRFDSSPGTLQRLAPGTIWRRSSLAPGTTDGRIRTRWPRSPAPPAAPRTPETARFCRVVAESRWSGRSRSRAAPTNPLANRFCGSCGTALVPVQERPSRAGRRTWRSARVVTMLFADLTASTEMSSRLDPEDLRSVLRPFFDAMAGRDRSVRRHRREVHRRRRRRGVRGAGRPRGRSRTRDRCGLAMQRRLAELNTEVAEACAGSDLAMRSGSTPASVAHSIQEGS